MRTLRNTDGNTQLAGALSEMMKTIVGKNQLGPPSQTQQGMSGVPVESQQYKTQTPPIAGKTLLGAPTKSPAYPQRPARFNRLGGGLGDGMGMSRMVEPKLV